MIAALLSWWKKWNIDKKWPTPEEEGTSGGLSWRRYHTGAWG
jgi:hypothetical protein